MSVKKQIVGAVRGSIPLTCAAFAADGLLARCRGRSVNRDEHLGGFDIAADLAYARTVADLYTRHGPLRGRVAEIGPGGSAAVALFLLAQGCDSVDLLDRFPFKHDTDNLDRLYSALPNKSDLAKVRFFVGEDAAAERFFGAHQHYDAILSCAVLEHLYDPIAALHAMAAALNPGGVLLHQVDLRDHGMFTSGGHHELAFLGIPARLYALMSEARGRPNRVLVHRYRDALQQMGLEHELLVTHLVGVGELERPARYADIPRPLREQSEAEVAKYRTRLSRKFADLSDRDLAVSSIFIRAIRN